MAKQLQAAEAVINDPSASSKDLAGAGRLEQLIYFRLIVDTGKRDPTYAALDRSSRAVAQDMVRVGAALRASVEPKLALPSWRIVQPPPVAELLTDYDEAQTATGVPWYYLAGVHFVESRLSRVEGESSAGAQGPMQFLPSTWAKYGHGDINDTRNAILAAARLLAANGAPGDMFRALSHYNPSPAWVAAVLEYAGRMHAHRRAFYGFYEWQVLYRSTAGTYLLPAGYPAVPAQRIGA